MADDFDPDAFLGSKPEAAEKPFDPDAFLGQPARSWSDVPGEALRNVPSSAVEFGKAIAQPFLHPVQTAQDLGALGGGVMQKLGVMSGEEYKPHADAVGKFLMDRYGSAEAIKNSLATDPVGMAADVSLLLTGGGGLAARVPGVVGKVGEVAAAAGRLTDPLTPVVKAGELAARGVGEVASGAAGLMTHAGKEPFVQAAKAGYEGGEAAKAFRENITATAPTQEAVQEAAQVVSKLRQTRAAEYRTGMKAVAESEVPLAFDKIDSALADITQVGTYKGVVTEPFTQEIRAKIGGAAQTWKMLGPEYHTAEGMDAFKQMIGDIRDQTEYGTRARLIADQAYHAVRQTIVDEVPQYAKVMKGYEEASNQIKTLQKELSLAEPGKLNVDTALKKLQSTLRNNVNTSFQRRKELANFLVNHGAPNLMYKLAGQTLQPGLPRGLGKLGLQIGAEMAAIFTLHHGVSPGALAAAAGATALSSPRLLGEAAYWGGAGARQGAKVFNQVPGGLGRPAAVLGRTPQDEPPPFKRGGSFKQPKSAVDYGHGMPSAHCGICAYFHRNGVCDKVQGIVKAEDWCKLWRRKKS